MRLQFFSLLFVHHEAVDVGEQLIGRHGDNEALSIQPQLIQQHHAEIGSGDPENLSTTKQ